MVERHVDGFGAVLRRYRLHAGLSQEALAERAGLSPRGVQDLERGVNHAPRADTVERLATALCVSEAQRAEFAGAAGRQRRPGAVGRAAAPAGAQWRVAGLPVPPTPLIGREHETAAAMTLLRRAEVRLLTLMGPGGVGKTRLALRMAEDVQDDVADGVAFVALASLTDPELVATTVARALGIAETKDRSLTETLAASLGERRMLLVLDNFEHLLPAALLVTELLAACPRLKVLVTSRIVLQVRGEHQFAVPPLALPDPSAEASAERVMRYEAVRLFVARAREVKPAFQVADAVAPIVAEICRRLDGLPLAIELAAARTRILPPRALLARLAGAPSHAPLQVLVGGARDLPARQQTLRDTIAWSYELLRADEQALFRRLAVFAGGCAVEAAEAVCVTGGGMKVDVLEALDALARQSLVVIDETPDELARVRLLETLRAYGLERLAAAGEAAELRRAHAAYYLEVAAAAGSALKGPNQVAWLARLEAEHDNMRAALEWAHAAGTAGTVGAVEVGLRLAGALWSFWVVRGHLREGRAWLEGLLALPESETMPAAVRAKALNGAGLLAWRQGDVARMTALCDESLALYRELGDRQGIADVLNNQGSVADEQGDYRRAAALLEEILTQRRELGDPVRLAIALGNLGITVYNQGDMARARALFEEGLALHRRLGDTRGIAITLGNLGEMARDQGDLTRAAALLDESLALRRQLGDTRGVATALHDLGAMALARGDHQHASALCEEGLALARELGDRRGMAELLRTLGAVALIQGEHGPAMELYRESLQQFQDVDDKAGVIECVGGIADVRDAQGQARCAAVLCGAVDALRIALGVAPAPVVAARQARLVTAIRAALPADTFEEAWAEGQGLTLAQAITRAHKTVIQLEAIRPPLLQT